MCGFVPSRRRPAEDCRVEEIGRYGLVLGPRLLVEPLGLLHTEFRVFLGACGLLLGHAVC
jgi:hypothetical protein